MKEIEIYHDFTHCNHYIPYYKINLNKPSRGVSRLPTVFIPRKLSKYRLKPPKDIVLGNPKKPDKTPKNGQNRF